MIYVMSQKFLEKYIVRLAEPNPYFILDGENYSVTGTDSRKVGSTYNNCHCVGSFTPETSLYNYLRKIQRGDDINEHTYARRIREFLSDIPFIASVCQAFKTLIALGCHDTLNVFVVLPNLVYKFLGGDIIQRMDRLGNLSFKCIYSQADLRKNWKLLNHLCTPDQLREIDQATKWIEKHYHLKYREDDD